MDWELYILQYILDGTDGHTQFHVAVAVQDSQQKLVVRHYYPSVVITQEPLTFMVMVLICSPSSGLLLPYSG